MDNSTSANSNRIRGMDRVNFIGQTDANTKVHGLEENKVELVITEIRLVFVAKACGLTESVKNGLMNKVQIVVIIISDQTIEISFNYFLVSIRF
jgi:hypothetical protein